MRLVAVLIYRVFILLDDADMGWAERPVFGSLKCAPSRIFIPTLSSVHWHPQAFLCIVLVDFVIHNLHRFTWHLMARLGRENKVRTRRANLRFGLHCDSRDLGLRQWPPSIPSRPLICFLCARLLSIIRFMNYAGCKRKFDISAYVSRVRALVKIATGK